MRFWILTFSLIVGAAPVAQANVLGSDVFLACIQNFYSRPYMAICKQTARTASGVRACTEHFGSNYDGLACAARAESGAVVDLCVERSSSMDEAMDCIKNQGTAAP